MLNNPSSTSGFDGSGSADIELDISAGNGFWDQETACPIMFMVRAAGRSLMRAQPRVSKAFTLVELLVVIGIMTLLTGLLLPTLAKAKGQASAVACEANLRSIGQALQIYVNTNGGRLPYVIEPIWMPGGVTKFNVDPADEPQSLYNTLKPIWKTEPKKSLVCLSAYVGYPEEDFKTSYRISSANNYDSIPATVDLLVNPASGVPQYGYSLKVLNGRQHKMIFGDYSTFPPKLAKGVGPYYLVRDFVTKLSKSANGADIQYFPHNNKTYNQLKMDFSVTAEKEILGGNITSFYP